MFTLRIEIPPIEININQGGAPNHSAIIRMLTDISSSINQLKETTMSALSDLQAAVAAESTVIDSAIVAFSGLKAALDAAIASGDPAALTALSTEIGVKTAALAAAIPAGTPAA